MVRFRRFLIGTDQFENLRFWILQPSASFNELYSSHDLSLEYYVAKRSQKNMTVTTGSIDICFSVTFVTTIVALYRKYR